MKFDQQKIDRVREYLNEKAPYGALQTVIQGAMRSLGIPDALDDLEEARRQSAVDVQVMGEISDARDKIVQQRDELLEALRDLM